MELIKEILIDVLKNEAVSISIDKKKTDLTDFVEMKCCKALCEIKDIIENPSYSDETCFDKIEKIVCVFEAIGSTGGTRHDFG